MNKLLRLIMISAMYENGGNVTHRYLDGHEQLHVYPFESQLGNSSCVDRLSSLFPFKYRWPAFPLGLGADSYYDLFFDEEMKVRLRSPAVSKFRSADLQLDEHQRREEFRQLLGQTPAPGHVVTAFFAATFSAWTNLARTGQEQAYVGYSPIVGVDTDRILRDLPDAQVVHVVRNPYSAYADTKKRPFPLSLQAYAWTWSLVQYMALTYRQRYPDRFHLLRYEDLISDPKGRLEELCHSLNLSPAGLRLYPSWNGSRLESVYPWGTIIEPTAETNRQARESLTREEHDEIRSLASVILPALAYEEM